MHIETQTIELHDFSRLIEFDRIHLSDNLPKLQHALDHQIVSVLDEEQLTQLTNNSYVGIRFIRESNQIVFERF